MVMIKPLVSFSFWPHSNVVSIFLTLILFASRPGPAQVSGKASALPGKDDVLEAIGHQQLARDPHLQFQIKPWSARPGSFVALVYLTAPVSDDMDEGDGTEVIRAVRLQPTLALLANIDGHLVATAKSDGPQGPGKGCRTLPQGADKVDDPATEGTLCKKFDFDLAPYRITPTETAIGVRIRYHNFYPAGEGQYEDLTLFEAVGHELKPVFSEEMSGSFEERGPNEMNTSKATLQVSAQKTGDHFDLLLVEHRRTEKLTEDSSAGHPGSTLVKRRFVWSGSAYVEAK